MSRLTAIALCLLCGVNLVWAGQLPGRTEESSSSETANHYQGIVFMVTDDRLTLITGNSPQHFSVGNDTLIVVNGRGGQVRDVQPGYLASIIARVDSGNRQAKYIEAYLPK